MEHPILSRVELVSVAEIGDPEPGHFTGYRNQHLVLLREPGSRARRVDLERPALRHDARYGTQVALRPPSGDPSECGASAGVWPKP